MKNFFNTVWLTLRTQLIMRFRLVFVVLLFMTPLIIFVIVFKNYEGNLPEGMAEVMYMVLGFILFGLLIRSSKRSAKCEKKT